MPAVNGRALIGAAALLALAGCGGTAATSSGTGAGSSGAATVKTASVSGHGTVLVAGSNSMTLYVFSMDTPGSGTSACTGSCIGTWPPLTVPAGTTPTAGPGVTGMLATIVRSDGHGIQVTYNGRPLHFFSGDTKPGDSNGNYPQWSVVPPSGAAASNTPTSAGGYPYGG